MSRQNRQERFWTTPLALARRAEGRMPESTTWMCESDGGANKIVRNQGAIAPDRSRAPRSAPTVLLADALSRNELVDDVEQLGIAASLSGARAEFAVDHHGWRARNAVAACQVLRDAELL